MLLEASLLLTMQERDVALDQARAENAQMRTALRELRAMHRDMCEKYKPADMRTCTVNEAL